jgi:dual specificity tyrosine-phosphorylation-regulated kinase 2/3/4
MIRKNSNASPNKKSLWKNMQLPITPETALKLFSSCFNTYEQTEILSYPSIYYIGLGITKIKTVAINNFGFDDEKGDYKIIPGDHIGYRYEIKSVLGRGSFGQVVKVIDHKEKKEIALKIIKNRPRFHQQAFEEVEILKYLKDKDPQDAFCIVHLEDSFNFRKHMVKSI